MARWRERVKFAARALAGRADDMLIPFPWSSPAPRSDLSTLNGYRQTWPFRAATDRMASGVAMSGWSLVGIRDARGALIRNHDIQFAPPALRQKMLDALPPEQIQAVSTHPLLSMLRSGNPWIVGISLMEMTQIYIDLTGKAFWLLERKQVGNLSIPYRAWPLPPHWIQQLPTPGTPYYEVHFPNSLQRIAETDVLRFHRPDVLNPYMQGNGLGSSLGDVDNFMRFASEFLSSHFYNRAIPPFIGMIQGIGEEGLKKLQARFFEEQQGQFKGGKPFFINREMKVSELSQRFDSMQLVELLHYGRDSFQQTYAIPPELLGILTNANRSTVAVANYVHSRWNLVPRLEFIRATFQERLVPLYDPRLIITYASPVEEDSDFYKSVMDMHEWAFSEDELRAMAGKGPEAGGAGKVHRFPAKSWFGTIPMAAAQGPASAGLSAKAQKIRAQQSPTRRTGTDD